MAGKQKDYLADLLANDTAHAPTDPEGRGEYGERAKPAMPPSLTKAVSPASPPPRSHRAAMSLLGRESALARVASGEVRQVTQLSLDPARVRPWPGNARRTAELNAENTADLIDAIIAEGGQKVPAIVRRIEGDPDHDYEVIAGTRRHFAIVWLRANSYPDMRFLAQVADLDDEAAFRLADIENRARKDVSDIERARNYAAALKVHYGGKQARMVERLRLSKGWLSKMIAIAAIPDRVIDAFPSPHDLALRAAYPLAQALGEAPWREQAIFSEAGELARAKIEAIEDGRPPLSAAVVLRRLMGAGRDHERPRLFCAEANLGRPALSVSAANRQGLTIKIHAGSGASEDELVAFFRNALAFHKVDTAKDNETV